ncbi:hypothetical protein ACTJJ7_15635 [Phyllobacterium sp. 22229]|uniref:hypothetical protein n=1 Tax=Phyllobacterium sp. 22229 TaxID=3453895 RepID=UPI003F86DC87
MKITPPKALGNYSNRFNDCRLAIDDALRNLIGDTVMAGWNTKEVLTAINELVDETMIAITSTDRIAFEADLISGRKKKTP